MLTASVPDKSDAPKIAAAFNAPYVRQKIAMQILGVGKTTLWRWLQEGKLRAKRSAGATWFEVASLFEYQRSLPDWVPEKDREDTDK